jgi:hypothetical protein
MSEIDHLKLVRRDPAEMERFRRLLVEASAGMFTNTIIMHEANNSCCQRESWEETARLIVAAVNPPARIVMIDFGKGKDA